LELFDSHAHLTGSQLREAASALVARATAAGVTRIANICTDADSLERGLALAQVCPGVINTGGVHPHDVNQEGQRVFDLMASTARSSHLVAVGETGLDYFYEHSPRDLQQEFLRKSLTLALECHLPVVIHCRDAFDDFFSIVDADYQASGKHGPGILHCFTGTMREAEQVLKRGFYLSLSGIVTYKNSDLLRAVAREVPLTQLLLETDAPFLAPLSRRGKVNEPAFVGETCAVIAHVKGLTPQAVAQATFANACRIYQQQILT
jgi:TatD DNase family protein